MERGKNNKTKSSFKMKKNPVKFMRGRGRTAAEVAQDEMSEQGRSGFLGDIIENARGALGGQVATDPVPRPTPEEPQVGQVGMMGVGGNNRYMFGGRGQQQQQLSQAQQRFNEITGQNIFGVKKGIFGMPSRLPSGRMNPMYSGIGGALAFKRKPSGFKMKKK